MIETKPKKCKGTTSETKGFGCGKLTRHRVYGLGKMCCYSTWLLNTEAGKMKLAKATLKVTKPRKDLEAATKQHKDRKSITTLIESVKTVCHNYIKARDKGKPCISCLTPWHNDFQAGHFYKAELFSTIKFNEFNINGQCIQCNLRKEGNESQYRVNLPNRIGKEDFEELNRLATLDKKIDFKWDREALKEIRNYYKQKLKELN